MSILDNLPHRCTIKRRYRVKEADGLGVAVDQFEVISTDTPCWEQQASASETHLWGKRGITVDKKIFFTSDPLVGEDCVVLITFRYNESIAEEDQVILDVKSEPEPDASAGLGVVWRVMVNSMTGSP